jgi:peptidoglycan/xylan/chitin deacetylase (PgdA/CDA1 family)
VVFRKLINRVSKWLTVLVILVLLLTGYRASAFYPKATVISKSQVARKFIPLPTSVIVLTPTLTPTPTPVPTITPTVLPTPTLTPAPATAQNIYVMPEAKAPASRIIRRGNTNEPKIAFTFDDGGEGMRIILEILDRKGIRSTFFLTAGELRKNPDRWRQAVRNGHQVCNHTLTHRANLANQSNERITQEIIGWERVAAEVLGEEYVQTMKKDFPIFRSPGGSKGDRLLQILGNLGYPITAYWTVEDIYFANNNPHNISITAHYRREAGNGIIYLMHSGNHRFVEEIIDLVQADQYQFCLLSEIVD